MDSQVMEWRVGRGLLLVLFSVFLAAAALAQGRSGDQGLGVMIGNPSGLSWKMFLDNKVAIDAAAGVDRSEFDVHLSLLFHNYDWTRNARGFEGITSRGEFPVYFGFGPRLLFEHKSEFGIRFPVGVAFFPHNTRWEMFAEVAPVLRLTPSDGFNGDFAIGARYYFPAVRPRVANP